MHFVVVTRLSISRGRTYTKSKPRVASSTPALQNRKQFSGLRNKGRYPTWNVDFYSKLDMTHNGNIDKTFT